MRRIAPVAAIWMAFAFCQAAAGDMRAPRLMRADINWKAASASLETIAALQPLHASAGGPTLGPAIRRLNAATGDYFPGIDRSPLPVLLPFDTDAWLHDRAAGALSDDPGRAYFFGFHPGAFFYAGPAGYDATFRVQSIPEFAQARFSGTTDITITGSLLTYDLDPPPSEGVAVPALAADFPGIRRLMLEGHVRYLFTRYGASYVVSALCFDSRAPRFRRMTCHDADRLLVHVLKSLRLAGGMPRPVAALGPRTIERPANVSPTFAYDSPGRLVPGTGFRGRSGRADDTVYADIRFPLAEAPAFVNSQRFRSRPGGGPLAYPWHDNFCERRAFYISQCPGGFGHQGQDIRAAACNRRSVGADRCSPHHNEVVAVRGGAIMRAPAQEAVFLVVNTPTDHIRFRYLHMRPKLLDANAVLSGRQVKAGEVLGHIGNYSGHENGTSYHLHFDAQVLTRSGWIYVNPYMTLVAAYERLIGGRGEEIRAEARAGGAMTDAATASAPLTLAAVRHAILAPDMAASQDTRHERMRRHAAPRPVHRSSHAHARRSGPGSIAAAGRDRQSSSF